MRLQHILLRARPSVRRSSHEIRGEADVRGQHRNLAKAKQENQFTAIAQLDFLGGKETTMFQKHLSLWATLLVLLAICATPASAHVLTSATAAVRCGCNKSTIKVSAAGLTVGTDYVINYTVLLTPASGSSITISSQILFTATATAQTVSATIPLGGLPTGTFSLSGTATLTSSGSTVSINFITNPVTCPTTTTGCSAKTSNSSNFNGTAISGGNYIWFNSNFTATGIPSTGTAVTFTNSTISFTANGVNYNLAVPNSTITFSASATCATVSFDTVNNQWDVTVPVSGSDEIFLSGLAFPVPAAGLPGGINNVTWSGTVGTNVSGIDMQWKWGAAVYTSFSTDYNSLDVKPTHQSACAYNNGDHAGTPENAGFQSSVVGGARGGGGSNFTGSWSGTMSVTPVCSQ